MKCFLLDINLLRLYLKNPALSPNNGKKCTVLTLLFFHVFDSVSKFIIFASNDEDGVKP